MLRAIGGLVFFSRCVDVVRIPTESWEEAYLLTGRPCPPECFPDCRCMTRALSAIGPWAADVYPMHYEESGDGIESWEVRRYV